MSVDNPCPWINPSVYTDLVLTVNLKRISLIVAQNYQLKYIVSRCLISYWAHKKDKYLLLSTSLIRYTNYLTLIEQCIYQLFNTDWTMYISTIEHWLNHVYINYLTLIEPCIRVWGILRTALQPKYCINPIHKQCYLKHTRVNFLFKQID